MNVGGASINIAGIAGFGAGTYPLITAGSPSDFSGLSNLSLASTSLGLFQLSLDKTFTNPSFPNSVVLKVTGTATPAMAYWKGGVAGGPSSWSGFTGSTTNWRTTAAGTTDTGQFPGGNTDVIFSVTGGGTNLNTTLGQDFGINSLHFTADANNAHSVTISGANSLTIGTGGLTIDAGSGTHTISLTGSPDPRES